MLIFGKTDIGKMRSSNQDVFTSQILGDDAGFGIVCDGMGGENGGQIASAIASQTIYESLMKHYQSGLTDEQYKDILISAVSDGNVAVYDESLQNEMYVGMGTTAVVVLMVKNKAYIAHVGDSRVYLLKEGELYQITKDHSIVQTLLEQGKITREEALTHPQKNMITRAIGVSCFVDIDYIEVSNTENSAFLLCSDGLSNTCSDSLIQQVLKETPAEKICETLIDLANKAGGIDNITTVYMSGV